MVNSTSITYRLKRKILTFTNKISCSLSKPDRKFTADMVYGILRPEAACLLIFPINFIKQPAGKYRKTTF